MSYLVLARKYRPQSFDDVVGQLPVSQTLLNAIESGRIAHAYVFSGPRGVGKTTTARILAKCLNCEKGPTRTPCNTCASCTAIAQGSSMDDVLEIDGASNRGIDQIRELRENAKYAPARSRYRIFIIDEVHQITKEGFGALLKTLEEPPAHVVFMMATTDAQKIPAPILSRCQRFSLRPIGPELVLKHLKEICAKEKVKAADDALMDIVRFVEGSMRDALSLLDQAIVFAPQGVTADTVRDLLGLLPRETVRRFATAIDGGDPAAILSATNDFVKNGVDLTQLAKDLQEFYHRLLLAKAGVNDPYDADAKATVAQAAAADYMTLERRIRLLSRALDEMRHSETPRAVFEVHAIRLGQKTLDAAALLERLEKLEAAGPSAPAPRMGAPAAGFSPTPKATPAAMSKAPTVNTPSHAVPAAAEPSAPAPQTVDNLSNLTPQSWAEFLGDVEKKKATLASTLACARFGAEGQHIVLTFAQDFYRQQVNRHMDILKPLIAHRFGLSVELDMRVAAEPAAAPKPAAPPPAAPAARTADDSETWQEVKPADAGEGVKGVLKHFSGTLKKERPTG